MSTRGCIAFGTSTNWRGVYNHYDSYPTGLGADFWKHVQNHKADLAAWRDEVLAFDDWRNYLAGGICPYCGKKAGQPHTIMVGGSGMTRAISNAMMAADSDERPQTPPDPDAKFHKHNEGDARDHHLTETDNDPLFIEWVYVVDVEKRELIVLAHAPTDQMNAHNIPKYKHVVAGVFPIDGPEPDWKALKVRE